MLSRDFGAELAALGQVPVNQRLRAYQVEANQAVEQAITDGKRKMLVTMATGTGKTLTTVNQTYRLMKSGVARRAFADIYDRPVLSMRERQLLRVAMPHHLGRRADPAARPTSVPPCETAYPPNTSPKR